MSTTRKSLVFLALTFLLSWGAAIGGWRLGVEANGLALWGTLTTMMAGPALAGVICALLFEKGRRIAALGLQFKPNWWWLLAYLIPVALCAASLGATLLLSDRTLGDLGDNVIAAVAQAGQDTSKLEGLPIAPLVLFQALVVGALVNSVALTFTEELGWRGYLYGLWRKAGFWRTSLGTGVIWGVWHAPAIYLFGHNYPDQRVLGVGLFTIFCVLMTPIITLVRDRSGSTWAAGIFHGTFNAAGGIVVLTLADGSFPWNGVVGIGGFVALALGVAAVLLLNPSKPPRASAASPQPASA